MSQRLTKRLICTSMIVTLTLLCYYAGYYIRRGADVAAKSGQTICPSGCIPAPSATPTPTPNCTYTLWTNACVNVTNGAISVPTTGISTYFLVYNGATCSYNVNVNCPWTATKDVTWINFQANPPNSQNGSVY